MIRSYGFMTIICPYMGIPRYGLNFGDNRDLHKSMGIKGSPTITDASSSIYGADASSSIYGLAPYEVMPLAPYTGWLHIWSYQSFWSNYIITYLVGFIRSDFVAMVCDISLMS